MTVTRARQGVTYEESLKGPTAYWAADYMAKGWFVWTHRDGHRYCHNPHHGEGPSGRDHEFRAAPRDEIARWFQVTVSSR